jgi:hypothetical protein
LKRKRLKGIPGMRNNPQKDKKQQKTHKNYALAAKERDCVGYGVKSGELGLL